MEADVSVIIPTYNRLEFLQGALDSVWSQSLPAREIIVVDDGSTDGTWEYLKTCSSLTALKQDNQGPAAARNLGARQAGSTWLAFLDSDDTWRPEKLARQVEFLHKHPEAELCQTEEVWIRKGVRVNPKLRHAKPNGEAFLACLPLCVVSPSAVVVHREFFWEVGGFDESFPACEDYELWLRMALRTPIYTLPEALTVKRGGHADQLSKKFWGMDRFRVKALEKTLKHESLSPQEREALIAELRKKLEILSAGHQKRHAPDKDPYREKILWLQQTHTNAPTVEPLTN